MSREEEKLLRMLFYECGGSYFEVIDEDGIRKPAIRTYLADVEKPTKKHGFDKEIWKVEISWRLLSEWLRGEDGRD